VSLLLLQRHCSRPPESPEQCPLLPPLRLWTGQELFRRKNKQNCRNTSKSTRKSPSTSKKHLTRKLKPRRKETPRKHPERKNYPNIGKCGSRRYYRIGNKKKDSKKVQEMWRFGLPPSIRGQVWKLAIGNDLFITKDLFDISIGHAQQTKATMLGTSPPKRPPAEPPAHKLARGSPPMTTTTTDALPMDELFGKEGTVALVSMGDLPEHFPARQLFMQGGPMCAQFTEVLEAYVAYRPDVGYVPCMAYLVACLLLNMDTLDTFICLANFINKPFNLAFYITDRSQMYKYTQTADSIMLTLLPKIHKHFQEVGIEPEHYLLDWFMTVFLKPLPLDIATRVWDLYFLEGELCLFKVALALLQMFSHQFETYPKDMCIPLLNHFPEDLDGEDLFDSVAQFNLDPKKFEKLLRN